MNSGELINFFAANGYLLDSAALSYIQAHDHAEIIELFNNLNPDVLVISLPEIRKIHRAKRTNAIIKYVDCFKPRLALVKKSQSFFEKVRDGLSIHANGGMQK